MTGTSAPEDRASPPDADTTRAALREVVQLALPLVLASASATLMHFVDVLLVSKLGKTELAAVMPAGILVFCFIALCSGLSSCVNTFVAQSLGRGSLRDCSAYAWQNVFASLIAGGAVLPLWWAAPALFAAIGHEAEVQTAEAAYFQIRLFGVGTAVMAWGLVSYFQGLHKPWVAFATTLVANGVNLALDYGLIFGLWGLPEMGIRGAAVATVLAALLQCVLLLGFLVAPPYARVYGGWDTCRLNVQKLTQLLRIGWPAGLNFFLDIVTWAVFMNVLVGRFGKDQLAGNNLAIQYMHLSFMPAMGLSSAATALMGKYIGRREPQRALHRAYLCLKLAMGYMTFMAAACLLFRYPLAAAFSDDPAVIGYGALVLVFAAVFQTADAVGIVSSGALRGAGDTHWAAAATIGCSWGLFLPLGWAFCRFRPELGVTGPWIGGTLYIFLVGGLLFWRLWSGRWRHTDIFAGRRPAAVDSAPD